MFLLLLTLFWSSPSAPTATAEPTLVAEDKFAAARVKFLQAVVSNSLDERRSALEALIALGDPDAVGVLADEYAKTADSVRIEKESEFKLRYQLERRQVVLENLKLQAAQDASVKDLLKREEEKVAALQKDLDKAQAALKLLEPWRDVLADGMAKLYEALGPSKRRKPEQEVWKDAKEAAEIGMRMASIELLGRVGGAGTAIQLHEIIDEASGAIGKLQARLDKAMVDVRKMEKRMQDEAAANAGHVSVATGQQYESTKKEAADAQTEIFRLEMLADAAARAGGIALSRETGKDLERSIGKLLGALKKKDRGRVDTLRMLSRATSADARAQVRALLAAETEPFGIGTLIDGLAALGDRAIIPDLISKYVAHESWFVRARAAQGLATLRSREAIPVLIARLGGEDGRLKTDLVRALRSLSGQKFHGNVAIWERWWHENEATFEVPPVEPPRTTLEDAKEASGVTFFGISTDSQRVLFILDLSGSMKFAMSPKKNPDDDPSKPYDFPKAGESSRLEAAKLDLVRAVRGLRDGGVFTVVMFASDVWTWSDDLVTMSADARAQVVTYIEKLDAVGGTNIYGALERGLDLAGAKGGGQWTKPPIDTIYLLTDGRATVGLTTDAEQIIAFVRERNATAGITIHTIGLSDAHDAVLLRRIAEENGGQYIGR